MACQINESNISDFFFGAVDETARARYESHLLSCRSCLENYLLLKRDVECGRADQIEPTMLTKRRIFKQAHWFLRDLGLSGRVVRRGFYFGVAAAVAVMVFALLWHGKKHTPVKESVEISEQELIDWGGENPGNINAL